MVATDAGAAGTDMRVDMSTGHTTVDIDGDDNCEGPPNRDGVPVVGRAGQTGSKTHIGDNTVTSVKLTNRKTGEQSDFETDGVFIFVGHYPNSKFLEGKLAMDEHGYVITDEMTLSLPAPLLRCGALMTVTQFPWQCEVDPSLQAYVDPDPAGIHRSKVLYAFFDSTDLEALEIERHGQERALAHED